MRIPILAALVVNVVVKSAIAAAEAAAAAAAAAAALRGSRANNNDDSNGTSNRGKTPNICQRRKSYPGVRGQCLGFMALGPWPRA